MIARMMRGGGRLIGQIASGLRKLYFRTAYDVRFGKNVVVARGVAIRAFDGGSIRIGADTHILPNAIIEAKHAAIVIGPRALINIGVFIGASFGISIGADALIAEYVTIRDADHGFDDPALPFNRQGLRGDPIEIGDNVWLAAKVTVTSGVAIGADAIVGANAVVTRSLPAGGRYGGVPARRLPGGHERVRGVDSENVGSGR